MQWLQERTAQQQRYIWGTKMEFLDRQNRTTFSKYPIFCYNGADVCRLAIEQINSGCSNCSVAKDLADQSGNAVVTTAFN